MADVLFFVLFRLQMKVDQRTVNYIFTVLFIPSFISLLISFLKKRKSSSPSFFPVFFFFTNPELKFFTFFLFYFIFLVFFYLLFYLLPFLSLHILFNEEIVVFFRLTTPRPSHPSPHLFFSSCCMFSDFLIFSC